MTYSDLRRAWEGAQPQHSHSQSRAPPLRNHPARPRCWATGATCTAASLSSWWRRQGGGRGGGAWLAAGSGQVGSGQGREAACGTGPPSARRPLRLLPGLVACAPPCTLSAPPCCHPPTAPPEPTRSAVAPPQACACLPLGIVLAHLTLGVPLLWYYLVQVGHGGVGRAGVDGWVGVHVWVGGWVGGWMGGRMGGWVDGNGWVSSRACGWVGAAGVQADPACCHWLSRGMPRPHLTFPSPAPRTAPPTHPPADLHLRRLLHHPRPRLLRRPAVPAQQSRHLWPHHGNVQVGLDMLRSRPATCSAACHVRQQRSLLSQLHVNSQRGGAATSRHPVGQPCATPSVPPCACPVGQPCAAPVVLNSGRSGTAPHPPASSSDLCPCHNRASGAPLPQRRHFRGSCRRGRHGASNRRAECAGCGGCLLRIHPTGAA